jgi:hypothetical protein
MVTLLNKWQRNEKESFSDHRIITFHIEKSRDITNDYNFHGTKYIMSEGFIKFDDNFIKEIKNNFKISERENRDNTLYALLTSETDIEKAVKKYQDSITAASPRPFKVRKLPKNLFKTSQCPGGRRNLL